MTNEDEARKQVEEDTSEDLELREEDADKVAGGVIQKRDQMYLGTPIKE